MFTVKTSQLNYVLKVPVFGLVYLYSRIDVLFCHLRIFFHRYLV